MPGPGVGRDPRQRMAGWSPGLAGTAVAERIRPAAWTGALTNGKRGQRDHPSGRFGECVRAASGMLPGTRRLRRAVGGFCVRGYLLPLA